LKWNIESDAEKSFALIMEDSDTIPIVGHPYVHWGVYNIPGDVREILEGATLHAMPAGSVEAINDDEVPQYAGPCPPQGTGTHHYHFMLYALNTETLEIDTGHIIRRSDFETLYSSSIIQKAEIIGLYAP
jgi:Raf kinase inhibitor-like YbhB/YbcL family protein